MINEFPRTGRKRKVTLISFMIARVYINSDGNDVQAPYSKGRVNEWFGEMKDKMQHTTSIYLSKSTQPYLDNDISLSQIIYHKVLLNMSKTSMKEDTRLSSLMQLEADRRHESFSPPRLQPRPSKESPSFCVTAWLYRPSSQPPTFDHVRCSKC
jgi:hypothetical protein